MIKVINRSIPYNRSHNFKSNTECICCRYGIEVDVLEVGVTNWIFWQTRDFKVILKGEEEAVRIVEEII